MATTDLERLVVQLSADVRAYQRSLDRAVGITNRSAGQIENRFNRMNNNVAANANKAADAQIKAANRAAAAQARVARQAAAAQSRFFVASGSNVRGVLAGFGLTLGTKQIQEYADTWTQAGNKIASASKVAGLSARTLEEINDIATRSRSGFVETVTLYSRILQATRGIVKNESEVARITETVSKSFQAGGATAQEAAGAVIQLAQALGSGTLQGDELRSLRENAPLLAQAIAKEFGVTVGELKQLGSDGELVTERVVNAIINATSDIEAAFATTNPTISNGFKAVENSFVEMIGKFDASAGVTASLNRQLNGLSKILDDLGNNTDEFLKQWDEFLKSDSPFAKIINSGLNPLLEPGRNFASKLEQGRNPFDRQFFFGGEDTGDPTAQRKAIEDQIRALEEQRDKLVTLTEQQRQNGLIVGGNILEIERLNQVLADLKNQLAGISSPSVTLNPAEDIFRTDRQFVRTPSADSVDGAAKNLFKASDGLLKVISKLESGNNPNIINNTNSIGGAALKQFNLINMSIREVLALQARVLREGPPGTSSAAGLFQITKATLEDFTNKLNISLDEKFTPDLQKKIAEAIVASTNGDPSALRGRFESLNKFSDDQLRSMFANDADAIVRGNEALQARQKILDDLQQTAQVSIDQSKLELAVMGQTTEEAARLRAEAELFNQVRAQGGNINDPEVIAGVKAAAAEMAKYTAEVQNAEAAQEAAKKSAEDMLESQREAAEQLQETMSQIGQAFGGALQGFISDLINGKKLTDALRDALIRLGESLFQIALQNLTSGLGGGGGGFLGGLFGGGGGGGGLLSGLFHGGGVVGRSGGLRMAPAGAFVGAKRYHSGRVPGLAPNEMAGIFKKDEIIFPNMESLGRVIKRFGGRGGSGLTQYNTFIAPDWKASIRSQNQLARSAGAELSRVNRTL